MADRSITDFTQMWLAFVRVLEPCAPARGSAWVLLLRLLATLAMVASHGRPQGEAVRRREAERALLQAGTASAAPVP